MINGLCSRSDAAVLACKQAVTNSHVAHVAIKRAECESKRESALQEVVNFWAARQGLARWLNPAGKRCWLHQEDTLHLAAGLVLGRLHRASSQPLVGHVAFTTVITVSCRELERFGLVSPGVRRFTPTHGTAGLLRGASGLLAPNSGARSSCEHICATARADTARARVELAAVEQSTAQHQGREGGVHLVLSVRCIRWLARLSVHTHAVSGSELHEIE